jgi:hypothetical protein
VDEEIECVALTGRVDVLGISLHAITDVRALGFETMKVYVFIGDTMAITLIDSNSSHNFIDVGMEKWVDIHLHPSEIPSIYVDISGLISSPGKVLS